MANTVPQICQRMEAVYAFPNLVFYALSTKEITLRYGI